MITVKEVWRKSDTDSNGTAPIYFRITKNRRSLLINSGYRISELDWQNMEPRLEYYLNSEKLKIQAIILDAIHNDWSLEYIRDRYLNKPKGLFFQAGEELVAQSKDSDKYLIGTALKSFLQVVRNKNMSFSEIKTDHVYKFIKQKQKDGIKNNTINTYIVYLRKVFDESGFIDNPFRNVKRLKSEKTKVRALSLEDFKKILNHKPQSRASELYILQVVLRGIDFVDMIGVGIIDKNYIVFSRAKLQGNNTIKTLVPEEFRDLAKKHIGKYKYDNRHGYISFLRRTNEKLVELGKELGIETKLTTKTARFTFANIAKQAGINRETIAEMLGHEWNQTTDIYLDKFPQETIDQAHKIVIKSIV